MPLFGLIVVAAGVAALFYAQYRMALSQVQPGNVPPDAPAVTPDAEQSSGGVSYLNLEVVKTLARAIAFAEGFYTPGSRASRNNNPGDLTADIGGNSIHPVGWDGPFAIYASPADGFADLEQQIMLWLTGKSHVAGPNDTIATLATKYTSTVSEQPGWARNVASYLGIVPDTKLSEIA